MASPITLNTIQKTLTEQQVLPLFYHDDLGVCELAVGTCYEAGCRIFEFTNRGDFALEHFVKLKELSGRRWPGLLMGVGTIQSVKQAQQFQAAGADFLISPFMDRSIGEYCQVHGIPYLPGCMTPSEIHVAQQSGCTLVKIFPASVVTRDFIRAVKDVFPDIHYVVTGGIAATRESVVHWVDKDVIAVGLGSQFFKKEWVNGGKWEEIREMLRGLYSR